MFSFCQSFVVESFEEEKEHTRTSFLYKFNKVSLSTRFTVKLFAVGASREDEELLLPAVPTPLPAPVTLAGPPVVPAFRPPPVEDGAGEARLGGPTDRGAGPTLGGPTLPGPPPPAPVFDLGPPIPPP